MPRSQIEMKVLEKIKPSAKEKKEMEAFKEDLLEAAKKVARRYNAKPIFTGSTGRGTWLRGNHDIDLFLVLPRGLSREKLEKYGLTMGKLIAKRMHARFRVKYAEHPYTRIVKRGFDVDIVPCYTMRMEQNIKSAVDRSPLHAKFLKKALPDKLKDDVRLFKAFSRGIGIYGSDTKTEGLSGYLCELIIVKYKSFMGAIKNIAKWKPQVYIDLQGYWERRPPFKDPLVVIDPVDFNRNVAAALSTKNFMKLVKAAKSYLENPSIRYFFPQKKDMSFVYFNKLMRRRTALVALVFKRPSVIDDILYPQLRRAAKRLKGLMKDEEFRPVNELVWANGKAILFFELEEDKLPNIRERIGPPVKVEDRSREFLKKYNKYKPRIEGRRWVVDVPRRYKTIESLLRALVSQPVKRMLELGIPNYIAPKLKRANLLKGKQLWRLIKDNPDFGLILKEFYKG